MTERPIDLHEPEPMPRGVETLTVFSNALIVLAVGLLAILAVFNAIRWVLA